MAGILTKNEEPGTKNLVYYHYNANGNVAALTDATGVIAARYAYNPYGTLTTQSGAFAAANPFRFSTKCMDDETGLVYYGYRFFSPFLGRWLNKDLIGEKGGLNLLCFLSNNPENSIDLLGNICCCCCPEDVDAFLVAGLTAYPPPKLLAGVKLNFILKMSYPEKPPYNDCSLKWEESSDQALKSPDPNFPGIPGDGKFHDRSKLADTQWKKRTPCVDSTFTMIDNPNFEWEADDLPKLPWEWDLAIRITLSKGKDCPCKYSNCTLTFKLHVKITKFSEGGIDITTPNPEKNCQ